MSGYIMNFTVYTMAMVGLIFFALFVYKKFMDGTMRSSGAKYLDIEETMSLNPRKTLHIVRAGNERFLIASDVDRTTLISKLGEDKALPTKAEKEVIEQVLQIDVEPLKQTTSKRPIKLEQIRAKKDSKPIKIDAQPSRKYTSTASTVTLKDMVSKINQL